MLRTSRGLFACLLAAVITAGACSLPAAKNAAKPVSVAVDPSLRFQTMDGWGGEVPNLHWNGGDPPQATGPTTPIPEPLREELMVALVDDLGMTRYGVTLFSGLVEPKNDNRDPLSADLSAFDFSAVDPYIRELIVPLRARVEARGERFAFAVKLITNAPRGMGPAAVHRRDSNEYAEFAVVTLQHLRAMGVEVSYWVIENEPDLFSGWYTPSHLGERIVRVGERMRASGFSTQIMLPETSRPGNVPAWLAGAASVPGALSYVGKISYHSYDYDPTAGQRPPAATRIAVANWARKLNLNVVQTEQSTWGRRDPREWSSASFQPGMDLAEQIFADLQWARVSEWWLYLAFDVAFGGNECCSGAPLLLKDDYSGFKRPKLYWALRQFMRYVRPGAVRIGAAVSPAEAPVRAAAFLSPTGKPVTILMNRGTQPMRTHLQGLPEGEYGLSWSTRTDDGRTQPAFSIRAPGPPEVLLPPESVATIWKLD